MKAKLNVECPTEISIKALIRYLGTSSNIEDIYLMMNNDKRFLYFVTVKDMGKVNQWMCRKWRIKLDRVKAC